MIEAFETKIDMAIKGNPRIINGNLSIPDSREDFFKDLKKNILKRNPIFLCIKFPLSKIRFLKS